MTMTETHRHVHNCRLISQVADSILHEDLPPHVTTWIDRIYRYMRAQADERRIINFNSFD